jgi:hypothetical protein
MSIWQHGRIRAHVEPIQLAQPDYPQRSLAISMRPQRPPGRNLANPKNQCDLRLLHARVMQAVDLIAAGCGLV